jgi:hypothetical protein
MAPPFGSGIIETDEAGQKIPLFLLKKICLGLGELKKPAAEAKRWLCRQPIVRCAAQRFPV